MDKTTLIEKILKATKPTELFTDLNYKTEFHNYLKELHPDVCKLANAREATEKLIQFKRQLETGITFEDDNGFIKYRSNLLVITGEEKRLAWSDQNYQYLRKLKGEEALQKYLPVGIENSTSEYTLTYVAERRVIPLNALPVMEQVHVNWILSRLLEFSALLKQVGFLHAGFNTNSVFIMPELHGIVVPTFYHMTRINQKLTTISGAYRNFYPSSVFSVKQAIPAVDLELCTRIATYLLGDKSGIGNSLKKTHNEDFVKFLRKPHTDPVTCYNEYRAMLKKSFETKFHPLNL